MKKGRQIEKDIFINTETIGIIKVIGILNLEFLPAFGMVFRI